MQPSMFNLRVPLPSADEVFLMNTLTDAQLVVSPDVAALLDRVDERERIGSTRSTATSARRSTLLRENGFLVAEPRTRTARRSTATSRRSRATPSSCTSRC